MTTDGWKEQIKEIVRKISDAEYQYKTWFGAGPRISSPEELYCQIFDDAMFGRFLDENRAQLSDEQLAAAAAFKSKMNEYELPDAPDPKEVIDNPGWIAVRSAASAFLKALG